MRRAEATSTSQRETRPPPAGVKNRRRRLPRTSTTSPVRQVATDRAGRFAQTTQSSVSTLARLAAAPCLATMTRNFHISSPRSGGTCSSPAGRDNLADQGHLVPTSTG